MRRTTAPYAGRVRSTLSAALAVVLIGLLCVPVVASAAADPPPPKPKPKPDLVRVAMDRALSAEALPPEQAQAYLDVYAAALRQMIHLDGAPKRELRAVVRITRDIAGRKALSASRMPAVFLTLQRNTEYWGTTARAAGSAARASAGPPGGSPGEKNAQGRVCKPFPKARAARVMFPGSRVVFQHYPGLGLQIQVLATFATAQAQLSIGDPAADALALQGLDEMVALISDRSGFAAWEYFFPFAGAAPPWTSAISQSTAVRALATAGVRLNRPDLVALARRAVALFDKPTPIGVRVPLTRDGNWYALYSFAPDLRVLNAHLQSLNGLFDVAQLTNDGRARRLYTEGLRAARRHRSVRHRALVEVRQPGRRGRPQLPRVQPRPRARGLQAFGRDRDLRSGAALHGLPRGAVPQGVIRAEPAVAAAAGLGHGASNRRSIATCRATTAPVMTKRVSVIAAR